MTPNNAAEFTPNNSAIYTKMEGKRVPATGRELTVGGERDGPPALMVLSGLAPTCSTVQLIVARLPSTVLYMGWTLILTRNLTEPVLGPVPLISVSLRQWDRHLISVDNYPVLVRIEAGRMSENTGGIVNIINQCSTGTWRVQSS